MRYHVVVTGSRPEKNSQGHFLPMPEQNVLFIKRTLGMLDKDDYVALYHGAAKGVDSIADDYAFANSIRTKQFPAYWFDPTKPKNYDPKAGLFRNEAMVRAAIDAAYNKQDEAVIVLAFHNTETLAESRGTAHCVEFATKKDLQVRVFRLPVLKTSVATTQDVPFTTLAGELDNPQPIPNQH